MNEKQYRNFLEMKERMKKKEYYEYYKILEKIYKYINFALQRNQLSFKYEVPKVLIGKTNYNLKTCLIYLMKKLRDDNYNVKYKNPNILIISFENILLGTVNKLERSDNPQQRKQEIKPQLDVPKREFPKSEFEIETKNVSVPPPIKQPNFIQPSYVMQHENMKTVQSYDTVNKNNNQQNHSFTQQTLIQKPKENKKQTKNSPTIIDDPELLMIIEKAKYL